VIEIRAVVERSEGKHSVHLLTNGREREDFATANGGELLFLALATCYCNDIHREAARRGIEVGKVRVEVSGRFGEAPGSAAEGIEYEAMVAAPAPEEDILTLMRETDAVAEVHNTLRRGTPVVLARTVAIDTR
jgi:uncharacterized OsmC-like protein